MGDVGMAAGGGLELPYAWMMRNCITIHGQWMFPREAPSRMVDLIRAGLVRLEEFSATTFGLEQVNEAIVHAAQNAGAFRMTVITP